MFSYLIWKGTWLRTLRKYADLGSLVCKSRNREEGQNKQQTNKASFSLKHCIALFILIAKTEAGCLNENFWTNEVDFQSNAALLSSCVPSNSTYTRDAKLKVEPPSQHVCKWPTKAVFFHTTQLRKHDCAQSHIPSLKAARRQCIPHLRLLLGWMLDFWIVGIKFV